MAAIGCKRGCISLIGGSIGAAGFRIQYACEMRLAEPELSVGMTESNCQVRIGAEGLGSKLRVYLRWLRLTVSSLTRTEAKEGQLIVLTALELECAPIGPVRNDDVAELPDLKRRAQPAGVKSHQVANDLLEQSSQIFHGYSQPHRVTKRRCLQPPSQQEPLAGVSAGFVLKQDCSMLEGCC
jgi:hypothetical protein